MSQLYKTASKKHTGHPVTKPISYYKKYDDFINHHGITPKNIVEIGTYEGESTKILAESFPDSSILTLDLNIKDIDFSPFKNITYKQADQTNTNQLTSIIKNQFPDGIDLAIEDASHFGFFSKITFEIIFPLLKSKGGYFIEDWGTGYWDDWKDGARFQEFALKSHNFNIPQRIPSHDYGMVGFVKSLVDLTHESAIKNSHKEESIFTSRIESLEFGEGICMALKA